MNVFVHQTHILTKDLSNVIHVLKNVIIVKLKMFVAIVKIQLENYMKEHVLVKPKKAKNISLTIKENVKNVTTLVKHV